MTTVCIHGFWIGVLIVVGILTIKSIDQIFKEDKNK